MSGNPSKDLSASTAGFQGRCVQRIASEMCSPPPLGVFWNVFMKTGGRLGLGMTEGKCFLWQILNLENMICFEYQTWRSVELVKSLLHLRKRIMSLIDDKIALRRFFGLLSIRGGCIAVYGTGGPVIRVGQLHICNPHLLFRDKCRAAMPELG